MSITLLYVLTILFVVLVALMIFWSSVSGLNTDDKGIVTTEKLPKDINTKQKNIKDSMEVKHNSIYEVLPESSTIEFQVKSHLSEGTSGLSNLGGRFTLTKIGENQGPVSINVYTVGSDSDFVAMMPGEENLFDVSNFPSISFIGSSLEWINDSHAILIGDMTIKESVRKVAFYVENMSSEDKASSYISMKATANIRRSDFNLWNLASMVSDNVSLCVNIKAIKVAS